MLIVDAHLSNTGRLFASKGITFRTRRARAAGLVTAEDGNPHITEKNKQKQTSTLFLREENTFKIKKKHVDGSLHRSATSRLMKALQPPTYLKYANGFSNLENSGSTPPNTHSHTHTGARARDKKSRSVKYQTMRGNPSLVSLGTGPAEVNPVPFGFATWESCVFRVGR